MIGDCDERPVRQLSYFCQTIFLYFETNVLRSKSEGMGLYGTCNEKTRVNKMSDDGTKVTIRMGPEEIQAMEDFMADHDIGNRSDFIRDAISGYIASKKAGVSVTADSGIFVRFSDLQLNALENLVQSGVCFDEEEFIRRCVLEKIVPRTVEEEAFDNAFRAAQRNAVLK